jgi:hypothetical protein
MRLSTEQLAQAITFLLAFGKRPVRISAGTPTIVIETFRIFLQSLLGNAGMVPQIRPRSLSFTSVPNDHSYSLPSGATDSEILEPSLNIR